MQDQLNNQRTFEQFAKLTEAQQIKAIQMGRERLAQLVRDRLPALLVAHAPGRDGGEV